MKKYWVFEYHKRLGDWYPLPWFSSSQFGWNFSWLFFTFGQQFSVFIFFDDTNNPKNKINYD